MVSHWITSDDCFFVIFFLCLFYALFDAIVKNKWSTTDVAVMRSWARFYIIANVSMVCIPLSAICIDLSGLIVIIITVIRCRFRRNVLMFTWFYDLRLGQQFFLVVYVIFKNVAFFFYVFYFRLKDYILFFFRIWKFRKHVSDESRPKQPPEVFFKKRCS